MKHLVLGSEGLIGKALCEYLKKQNEKVLPIDIKKNGFEDLRIPGNISLLTCMHDCDFVHFLAYDVGGSLYMQANQDNFGYISNNICIMKNVFAALKSFPKPFYFASSQMSNMSWSTYGILKLIGEQYTKSLGGLIVKFWNVYGFENNPDKSHVITDFIKMALKDKEIKMMTDGCEFRQMLHAEDCARALFVLTTRYNEIQEKKQNEIHITNYEWTKIIEIAEIIKEIIKDCKITQGESADFTQRNKKNEPNLFFRKYWKPKKKLKTGIKELVEKYK